MTVRSKFTKEDDRQLIELKQKYPNAKWKDISSMMHGKSPRQVRERYNNYLVHEINGSMSNKPWTQEEDDLILEKFQVYGAQWILYRPFFKNRTNIMIKNRYASLVHQMNKRKGCDFERIQSSRNAPHTSNLFLLPEINQNKQKNISQQNSEKNNTISVEHEIEFDFIDENFFDQSFPDFMSDFNSISM